MQTWAKTTEEPRIYPTQCDKKNKQTKNLKGVIA